MGNESSRENASVSINDRYRTVAADYNDDSIRNARLEAEKEDRAKRDQAEREKQKREYEIRVVDKR